ncbi:MAG: DNA replication and repair protein RecF [Bacteroidales bacterium]|nr:DNA replication and repair protein RecF [Bacteroidales bacterium]MDD2425429.1 DNA replication and repair protein RecF [Bacteroidales bacterium]MDD3988884.1 DNA replication and repair protein RecF [Bacteroidales bacterium]MDD4638433.1 DNA replication and repair protein RecF [Bacteroidales bacterium]
MYLNKISVTNFKNISQTTLSFSKKLNCITGINGSGKTNLLDAVYFLSMTKSYFPSADQYIIRYGENRAAITGEYINSDKTSEKISVNIDTASGKQIKRNSKPYSRLSDHVGLIPVVMISPSDSALINESGEERRRYLNSILSQLDREYLRRLQNYNILLSQRNKLLKSDFFSEDLLWAYSEKMAQDGQYIYEKRREFVKSISPSVEYYYGVISGERESITIEYRSDLEGTTISELFSSNLKRDSLLRYTTSGIHRDDLFFTMNGHPIKRGGSQGQQKSFLVSLKLAQFSAIREQKGEPPVLLLDDIFDKLDILRVESLLKLVATSDFGQIFLTESNKLRVSEILETIDGDSLSFEIDKGRVI